MRFFLRGRVGISSTIRERTKGIWVRVVTDGLSFTAEITSVTTTTKLDQSAERLLTFKVMLTGSVGEISLDRLKELQRAGELRVTLRPLEEG